MIFKDLDLTKLALTNAGNSILRKDCQCLHHAQ